MKEMEIEVITNSGNKVLTDWNDSRITRGDYFGCLSGSRHKGSVQCPSCISEIKEIATTPWIG